MMDDDPDAEVKAVNRAHVVSRKVQRVLAGEGQYVQMAVLADLVSVFIAGHFGDDEKATAEVRAWALSEFVRVVDGLVPLSAAERGLPHGPINNDPAAYAREKLGLKQ